MRKMKKKNMTFFWLCLVSISILNFYILDRDWNVSSHPFIVAMLLLFNVSSTLLSFARLLSVYVYCSLLHWMSFLTCCRFYQLSSFSLWSLFVFYCRFLLVSLLSVVNSVVVVCVIGVVFSFVVLYPCIVVLVLFCSSVLLLSNWADVLCYIHRDGDFPIWKIWSKWIRIIILSVTSYEAKIDLEIIEYPLRLITYYFYIKDVIYNV